MKPAEKSEVEVVVVVVEVEVEVEKRRRSITKRGNKIVHVERASAVRLFPSTTTELQLQLLRTATTTAISQLTATQLLIRQFTMFKPLRLAPRLNVLRPVVRWNSTASPASPPLMTKIRTDLKVAMRAKDTSRYAILYIYIYDSCGKY